MARLVFRNVLILFAALSALPVRAKMNYRDSDYQGVFGAIAVGNVISTPGIPTGPTVRVGRVELDGNGNAKIQATVSLSLERSPTTGERPPSSCSNRPAPTSESLLGNGAERTALIAISRSTTC